MILRKTNVQNSLAKCSHNCHHNLIMVTKMLAICLRKLYNVTKPQRYLTTFAVTARYALLRIDMV